VTTPERLAAYLANDLDPAERAEVEDALARDPDLRRHLEQIRGSDDALSSLAQPEPSAEFSARLRAAVRDELRELEATRPRTDELAVRREARRRSLTPLVAAAAAAVAISFVGVTAGWLLRGAADDQMLAFDDAAPESAPAEIGTLDAGPTVTVIATGNDYGELELRRLAVNVDTQYIIHHETTADEAQPLADQLVGQLLRRQFDLTAEGSRMATDEDADSPDDSAADDPVAACLPGLLADATEPLVPVFVELARYQGEDAVIFVFVTEEPESRTYRRIEAWAVARDDCTVLGYAPYDRR
jgi:hypothetical protein